MRASPACKAAVPASANLRISSGDMGITGFV
jgi:hypothetical protein